MSNIEFYEEAQAELDQLEHIREQETKEKAPAVKQEPDPKSSFYRGGWDVV